MTMCVGDCQCGVRACVYSEFEAECINFEFGFVKLFVLLYVMYVTFAGNVWSNSLLM